MHTTHLYFTALETDFLNISNILKKLYIKDYASPTLLFFIKEK